MTKPLIILLVVGLGSLVFLDQVSDLSGISEKSKSTLVMEEKRVTYTDSFTNLLAELQMKPNQALTVSSGDIFSIFYLDEASGNIAMQTAYNIQENPEVFFKRRFPTLTAGTSFANWSVGKSLVIIFSADHVEDVSKEARTISVILTGIDIFDQASFGWALRN